MPLCRLAPIAHLVTLTCQGADPKAVANGFLNRLRQFCHKQHKWLWKKSPRTSVLKISGTRPHRRLDATQRAIVLEALHQSCERHGWILYSAHVRPAHLHAVIGAPDSRSHILSVFKSETARALKNQGQCVKSPWSQGGNVLPLWNAVGFAAAVEYILEEQGRPMALHIAPETPWERLTAPSAAIL